MIEGPQLPYYLVPLSPFLSFFTIYHLCPVNSDSSINHKACRYSPQKIRFWYSLSSQARGRKKGTIPGHRWWLKSETAACGRTAKLCGKITPLTFQYPATAPTSPQLGRSPGFQALPLTMHLNEAFYFYSCHLNHFLSALNSVCDLAN